MNQLRNTAFAQVYKKTFARNTAVPLSRCFAAEGGSARSNPTFLASTEKFFHERTNDALAMMTGVTIATIVAGYIGKASVAPSSLDEQEMFDAYEVDLLW
mmetsp:Transcript_43382/g.76521  ORF Transcript_43382/g.76521 Transcript_43382/m.76521 type:complete len:100 (+) Transcript_43382:87-386(+)|eukprot:CAMPEP_0194727482 /NCGR_PEP_ID=MMETSP0296-20130528/34889_1 /TAXON_ID=39354 /ORGANISM="Heterosigma akashiwo, Strain CCMP2393" /LENGTH=99 /DNA_ID=CAMNT_0039632901 /DNA_START=53 /DNA_END=352 /DNA_ORIENTATION=-